MNRRSMFKAAIGACAALLFPWRKAKAGPSWARVVDFVPSEHKHPCPDGTFDQTLRIERLLERWSRGATRTNWPVSRLEITTYEMGVMRNSRQREAVTRVILESNGNMAGVVSIDDSVAASMNDSELSGSLVQAFLQSLHKKESVRIRGKVEYTRLTGDLDKLGGLSKT